MRAGVVVAERIAAAQPGAGRRVAEDLHALLEEAGVPLEDVGRIVVGVGPGGFTGLRIGIATALGLGQALGTEVVGVSSLETLALAIAPFAAPGQTVAPVIDAKRGEVFTAAYAVNGDGGFEERLAPQAVPAEAFDRWIGSVGGAVVAGDGLQHVASHLPDDVHAALDPRASEIRPSLAVARADAGGARPVVPLYLRLPDAEVNRRRRETSAT